MTRIMIITADVPIYMGKFHKVPSLMKRLWEINESVFSRNEPLDRLFNLKWSAQNTYAFKQHLMCSEGNELHIAIIIREKGS